MADYVKSFHPRLVGLTGSPDEIAAVAKAYRVYCQGRRSKSSRRLHDRSFGSHLRHGTGRCVSDALHPIGTGADELAEKLKQNSIVKRHCCRTASVVIAPRHRIAISLRSRVTCCTLESGGQSMLYHWYELGRAAFRPARAAAEPAGCCSNPLNPTHHTPIGRSAAAVRGVRARHAALRQAGVRIYAPRSWSTASSRAQRGGRREALLPSRPLQAGSRLARRGQHPRLLLVAPMSGHFATLLRGTVETFLPDHEVYVTDWQDARDVPLSAGPSISTTTSTPWSDLLLRRRRARVRRVPAVRAGAGRRALMEASATPPCRAR